MKIISKQTLLILSFLMATNFCLSQGKIQEELPNPMTWNNGMGEVTNISQWKKRRSEISSMIQEYEIGTIPEVEAFIDRFLLEKGVSTSGIEIAPMFRGKVDLGTWITY